MCVTGRVVDLVYLGISNKRFLPFIRWTNEDDFGMDSRGR